MKGADVSQPTQKTKVTRICHRGDVVGSKKINALKELIQFEKRKKNSEEGHKDGEVRIQSDQG